MSEPNKQLNEMIAQWKGAADLTQPENQLAHRIIKAIVALHNKPMAEHADLQKEYAASLKEHADDLKGNLEYLKNRESEHNELQNKYIDLLQKHLDLTQERNAHLSEELLRELPLDTARPN